MPDHYAVLGLGKGPKPGYDLSTIKQAYREAVLRLHPDKAATRSSSAEMEQQRLEFEQVQAAWEVLSDPQKREEYDKYLKLGLMHEALPISDTINLSEMEEVLDDDGSIQSYTWPCRCGDCYVFSAEDFEYYESFKDAIPIIGCNTCSLHVHVLVDNSIVRNAEEAHSVLNAAKTPSKD